MTENNQAPFLIDINEYMDRMGKAITSYTQVFGAVVRSTIDGKVKTGQLTEELGNSIVEKIGHNLVAYLQQIEARMKAKMEAAQAEANAAMEKAKVVEHKPLALPAPVVQKRDDDAAKRRRQQEDDSNQLSFNFSSPTIDTSSSSTPDFSGGGGSSGGGGADGSW